MDNKPLSLLELKDYLTGLTDSPLLNVLLQVGDEVEPLLQCIVDTDGRLILSSKPIVPEEVDTHIQPSSVPVKFNPETQVVTVFVPNSEYVLQSFHTYRETEEEALNLVWAAYGPYIQDALKEYGYNLELK